MAKLFRYYLTNAEGRSYRISEDNVVSLSHDPVSQKNAPDGWQDKMVQFGRSSKYYGLMRSFTIPLRFVKQSARILRDIQYMQGFEAVCYLIILKLDPATQGYRSWYKGEIDLGKMKDTQDYVEVNVMEGGSRKLLTANEDKTYEFPLDTSAEILELDGLVLKNNIAWQIQPGLAAEYPWTLLGAIFISQEGASRDVVFGSPSSFTKADDDNLHGDSGDYILRHESEPIIYEFKAKYRIQNTFGTIYGVFFSISDGTNFIASGQIFNPIVISPGVHDIEWDWTVTLSKGQRLFISCTGGRELPPPHAISYLDGGTLDAKFDYRLAPTRHRAYQAEALANLLAVKVTGKTGSAPALKMTGMGTEADPARALMLISGDGVRRLSGAVLKTTYNDFFKSMDIVRFVGLDIVDEKIEIRPRKDFYNEGVPFDLGEVKSCEPAPAEDLGYNLIKIGYPNNDLEDVNGRYSFNVPQEYGLPITRFVRELNLICPYRADPYVIEDARVNMEGKTTTDNSSDNSVFIVDCIGVRNELGEMIWRPYRFPYSSIEGIITDTIFNIELSPKRLLMLHMPEIAPLFYRMTGKEITFQKSEKNSELTTTQISGPNEIVISEKANVPASIEGALYLPYYFPLETKVPVNLIEIIAASRSGCFQFTYNGATFKGFLYDGGIKPATMEEQNFKLLAAPTNDLKKLIR